MNSDIFNSELMEKMCAAKAPSGNEEAMRKIISEELSAYADEIKTDALGNLIVHKKGTGKRLMLSAGMDEVGIIVTYIEESGLVRFKTVGTCDCACMLSAYVEFLNGTVGVAACEKGKNAAEMTADDMYIDIGAQSRSEAEKYVNIGDVAVFAGRYCEQENTITAKSLGSRAGCCALAEAVKNMKDIKNDVYAVFAAQEMLGSRGAAAAAYSVNADFAVTIGVSSSKIGQGITVSLKSGSCVLDRNVSDMIKSSAEKERIQYQPEVLEEGGSANVVHMTRAGIKTGCICVPVRGIKLFSQTAAKSDITACSKVIAQLAGMTI